jgi:hypothetical protein
MPLEHFTVFPHAPALVFRACPATAPPPPLPSCSKILRRRRPGEAETDADGAVRRASITLERLEGMADLTLVAAAAALRVATTSLKKACRKLGVDHWPYRKDLPLAGAASAAAEARRE